MEVAVLHLDRLIALKNEAVAVREMRKHLAWYLKGLPGGARVKDVIMEETGRDRMVAILESYVKSLEEDTEFQSGSAASGGESAAEEVAY
jgi:tRNA-dihydrouridine synthase